MSSTPNKSVDRIFISFSFRGNKWDYDTTMFVCVCMPTLTLEGKPVSFIRDGNGTNAIKCRSRNLLTPIDIFKNDHLLFMYSVVGWQ